MSDTFDYDGDAFTPSFLEDAQRRQAAQSVVQSADADPDKAARAVDLGNATGVPAGLIHGDLDHFEQQQKIAVNSQLVRDNEFLQQYINSHPMAAAVSHDDFGQLDAASDALVKIPNKSALVRATDAFMASSGEFGAKEIFSDPYYRRPQDIDFAIQHPEMAAVMTSLTGLAAAPITVGSKLFSGALGVINEFGGRDLASMFEYGLMRGDINQFTGQLPKMAEAITAAKNYLRSGDEPPAGLHPLIDKAKVDQAKEDIGALDDALKESVKSATRERSPEFYANFARGHVGDREIGISADAVRDLYGDKSPEADDNVLGWVPGIADKLANAEATGGDVKVPLADWLAKVDPEVAKELHDHIRVRDGGLTVDEGNQLKEQKEAIEAKLNDDRETISKAAIRFPTGEVTEGQFHFEALQKGQDQGLKWKQGEGYEEGFTTSKNRFVDREEALRIARANDQVKPYEKEGEYKELMSGELKPGEYLDAKDLKEAKPITVKPIGAIPEPVPGVRGGAGLEPMFSVGDRKVKLERMVRDTKQLYEQRAGMGTWDNLSTEQQGDFERYSKTDYTAAFHDFDLTDETGKKVGSINLSEQKGGKQLYVEMIQAGADKRMYDPNFLGPSLIRDLYRQLKAEFPNAESITGHRVSGAREKAGSWEAKSAQPVVKFDDALGPQGWQHVEALRQIMQNQNIDVGKSVLHYNPTLGIDEAKADSLVREELAKIAPSVGKVFTPDAITAKGKPDVTRLGFMHPFRGQNPWIVVALESPDAVGVARHEAIHFLKGFGFFSDGEWSTLTRAARDQGWMDKFGINERYPSLDNARKLEEAVAEGFRSWASGEKTPEATHPIFEKLKELFENLKARLKELLGHEPTWEELFEKTKSGEVGQREAKGHEEGAFFEPQNVDEREAPKAANDVDVKGLQRAPTYQAAAKAQTIERYVNKDTERGDFAHWKQVAADEGHNGLTGKPNAFTAARAHSQDGKTTLLIGPEGNRTVFHDGSKVVREGRRDLEPSAMDIPKDEKPFERGAIMPKANQDRYDKLIQKRNEEDLDAAMKRAEAEQRQQQTKEWKDNRSALRTEVADDLCSRPDIATDALLAKGDIKLNPEGMTDEQKAALPREYMRKSNSISPDDLAPYFGFTSGDALVERLGLITHERVQAGMSQKDFFNRMVDAETDRQMEARHGNLDANILEEAKDQAISETQLDILHEEVLALGLKAGSEFPISKAELKEWNKQIFDKTPIGGISLDDYLRAAGKAGRAAETALLKEDYIEAFREKQRQNNAMIMAGFAKAYEKQRKSLDRTAKVFRKKDVPSVEPEYLNHIQDTLSKVGYPNARSLANIQENIQRQTDITLQSFIQAKLVESWGLRDMPLADFLEDPKWTKKIDELTADEFTRYKATVDSLVKNGRAEQKVIYQGVTADRKAVIKEMVDQLKTFPEQDIKSGSEPGFVRESIAGSTAVPTVMNRWDRGDPRGVFHKYVVYPLTQAANGENRLSREITVPMKALGPVGDLKKLVDSPLDPALWRYSSFTRENVLGMLQNAGNKSNWNVTARGWGADPEALMQWLHRNTTKEDWDRAQKMGDTVFKKLVGLADQVYEHENGRTIDKIPLEPIDTPFGTYSGWYHPLIPDGTWLAEKNKVRGGAYQDGDYGHIATSNGYTRTRNGSIYPVELSLDKIPLRISQMVHDISFRTPILEVQKILKDPSLLNAITAHYGKEYSKDFLLSYLKDMAGNDSIPSEFWRKAGNASEYLRQNVIGTYIGFNPYTVMKHAPTAFFMSARDVGPTELGKAYLKIYGKSTDVGGSWKDFINQNSEEIQRRERNWQETLAGQQKVLYGEPTARERVLQWGSWAVAQSDLFSAQALWLARYDKSLAEGSPHGEAVDIANRSVTRQHGSTASTNQPALVRGGGPFHGWLTSVYGFFGTVMQRRIEMVQNMNDIYQLGRQGEINQVANKLPQMFNDIITYVILPTAIEEGVTGLNTDDRRGWGSHLLSATTMGLTNSILYLRDVAYGLASGHDPGVGMASSALHDLEKTMRDLRQGKSMLSKQHAGKTVQDFLTTFGEATGTVPKTLANASRFGIDYINRQARPKNAAEVLRGLTRGTTERRIER